MGQAREAIDPFFGSDDHAPTIPAVTTIGATPRDILLAAEADAPVTTSSTPDINRHSVDEHGSTNFRGDG
jgi:phosphoglycerate dehydrogenase-like enzyme